MAPWFEKLINAIELSSGTKIMFNAPEFPLTAVEAIGRWFLVAEAKQ